MNTDHELERILGDWLEARTVEPPHGSLASALERTHENAQQRHRWLPGWFDRGRDTLGLAGAEGHVEPVRARRDLRLAGAAIVTAGVAAIALAVAVVGGPLVQDLVAPGDRGTVHYVAEDGDFATIAAAVAAAEDGDTVLVAPGTYREALIIDKEITLRGEDVPGRASLLLVPEDAPDPVRPLEASDSRADGLTLPERVPVGIQVIDVDATLRNIRIIGTGEGIGLLVSGGSPTLEDVTVKHEGAPLLETTLAGTLYIEGASKASVSEAVLWQRVRISGGSSPTISDSDLGGVRLVVQEASSPVFSDNSISGDCGCEDVVVVGGSTPTFEGNTFVFSGIDIVGSEGDGTAAHLEANRFSAHEADALSVSDGARATVVGNQFYGNNQGLHVSDASADVRDNEFVGNWNALMLSATDATVVDNTIRGGSIGVSIGNGSSSTISRNRIEDADLRGLTVADGTSPTIKDNFVCGSPSNLVVGPDADPVLAGNDICADGEVPAD